MPWNMLAKERAGTGMAKPDAFPATAALRVLKAAGVEYTAFRHTYEPRGGTAHCAKELGVDEHRVVKTIVLKTNENKPLIMLMHGDSEISLNKLARIVGVKSIETCEIKEAQRHSGYLVGGTSPFGFRKKVPIYAQETIFDLDWIIINGGSREIFVKISPDALKAVLGAIPVEVRQ